MNEDTLHYKVPLPMDRDSFYMWDDFEYEDPKWVSLWLARLFAGVIPEPIHVRYRMPLFAKESMYDGDTLVDFMRHRAEKEARERDMAIVYYTALREVDCFEFIEYQLEGWAVPIRYE